MRRELAKTVPEKYEPDVAETLIILADLHSPSGSIFRRIFGLLFSRRVREWAKKAKEERTETLVIAEKYPDVPACKEILKRG